MARRPPRKVTYFEPVAPRLARNTERAVELCAGAGCGMLAQAIHMASTLTSCAGPPAVGVITTL
jgi:hypothetical protein